MTQTTGQAPKTLNQQKADKISALQVKFNDAVIRERLIALAKGDEAVVITNLNSFFTILINDEGTGKGNDKKYLIDATTSSLALCFMESMQIGIPIDRRKLVHIVMYGHTAELEIDYRGFIYYLNKHYHEATFDVKLVFEGDDFSHWSESGDDKYTYRMGKDRKANDYKKVEWAYCFITYVKNGREHSKIEVMDKTELNLVRSKAKTKMVWDEWLGEMYKKAVVRRACKLPLAAVDENAIEAIDNKNFQLENKSGGDRLKLLMDKQKEILNNDDDVVKPKGDDGSQLPGGESGSGNSGAPAGGDNGAAAMASKDDQAPKAGSANPAAQTGGGEPRQQEILSPEGKEGTDATLVKESAADGGSQSENMAPDQPWRIFVGGEKYMQKDFASGKAAAVYLKKIISNRTHKATRQAIMEGNAANLERMAALGATDSVTELRNLSEQGE